LDTQEREALLAMLVCGQASGLPSLKPVLESVSFAFFLTANMVAYLFSLLRKQGTNGKIKQAEERKAGRTTLTMIYKFA